jgi:hypothetical protein
MNRFRPLALVASALALSLGVSACGGDDGAAVDTTVTATVPGAGTITGEVDTGALESEADEIERIVRDDLARLSDARSVDDVRSAVEGTRTQLEESAGALREADVADADLAQARDEVDAAVRDLSTQLRDVETAVADEDLSRTLTETAAALENRQTVEDALADLRRELERAQG